jgi:putative oxidoreductase
MRANAGGTVLAFLDKLRPLSLTLLRLGVGGVFIYHGFPKLFGSTARYVDYFGDLGFPAYTVYLVGAVELFGGLLIAVGLFTRLAALLMMAEMAVAIWKVHLAEGIYSVNEYEYQLALVLSFFLLSTTGAGRFSIDHLLFKGKG